MLVCNNVLPAGSWDMATAADSVRLDFDGRHRRRVAMTGERGLAFLLDLPHAVALRDGDGLALADGRVVRVASTPERLIEITAPDAGALLRIAWHLGNRHLPTQLLGDRLRIRHDHVILDMLAGLGAATVGVEAPFDPEGGAYTHAEGHHHHPDGGHH